MLANVGDCQAVYHGQVKSAPGDAVTAQTVRCEIWRDRARRREPKLSFLSWRRESEKLVLFLPMLVAEAGAVSNEIRTLC